MESAKRHIILQTQFKWMLLCRLQAAHILLVLVVSCESQCDIFLMEH